MQFNKVCLFMAAIIAVSLQGCMADTITCTKTGSETPQTCADGTTQCFIETAQDGSVTRGCLDSGKTCTAPTCLTCQGANCNAYLMCRQCNSTQTECGTTNAASSAYNQLCAADQWCRNELYDNGTVSRGCGAQCAANDAKCSSCNDKDNCNQGIYPANRRQCYECTGEACNTVTASMLAPCALYQTEGHKCYAIGSDAKSMVRGCTTDTDAKCTATSTAESNCLLCDSESGCNNVTYSAVLNKCIKCNNNAGCFDAQKDADAQACAATNYTQSAPSCYTQMFDNGTVARGCVNELDGACSAESSCLECSGEACNTKDATFTCYLCRSDNNPGCRKMENINAYPCTNTSLTSPDSKKCFSGEWDGIVLRGCLIDLSPLMNYQCNNDADDRCLICSGPNCNTETKKYNGAASLQHFGLGMLALFVLVRNVL